MSQTSKKKSKKSSKVRIILLIVLFTGLFFALVLIGINVYMCIYAGGYITTDENELPDSSDAIIVLGAGLTSDNRPGTVLSDRLDTAINLYKNGHGKKLLMSGDHGDDYHNEVRAMKDYALEKGVPEEDIFMDHAGFSTYDTMARAVLVFGVKSCVVVTQKYHLDRSIYIARKLGLDAYGYPSEIKINQWKYIPLAVREFFARIKAFFVVMAKPDPTYIGDPIPISGSGIKTDQ